MDFVVTVGLSVLVYVVLRHVVFLLLLGPYGPRVLNVRCRAVGSDHCLEQLCPYSESCRRDPLL